MTSLTASRKAQRVWSQNNATMYIKRFENEILCSYLFCSDRMFWNKYEELGQTYVLLSINTKYLNTQHLCESIQTSANVDITSLPRRQKEYCLSSTGLRSVLLATTPEWIKVAGGITKDEQRYTDFRSSQTVEDLPPYVTFHAHVFTILWQKLSKTITIRYSSTTTSNTTQYLHKTR